MRGTRRRLQATKGFERTSDNGLTVGRQRFDVWLPKRPQRPECPAGDLLIKLVYIVDWLPPDYGAIGQYALKEAEERAARGDDVVLLGLTSGATSRQSRDTGAGRLTVVRLNSAAVDRISFKRRAIWTLRTNLRLVASAAQDLLTADEILFTASPPFLEHLLVPLSPLLRGRLVFRIADLHPECMIAELPSAPSWLLRFQDLTRLLRRAPDQIEVLGEDQKRRLVAEGVPSQRIVLRRSGSPVSIGPDTEPLPLPSALVGRHALLYSGAVAHAHDIDTFVNGYELHHQRGSGRMVLWLNAAGGRSDAFEQAVVERRLPVHRSSPVPLSDLGRLLVTPAAHLITQRNEYVGLVVPSKVYGCVESGRDILFVGSRESDVDLICRRRHQGNAYQRVNVGDVSGMAQALELLAERAANNT